MTMQVRSLPTFWNNITTFDRVLLSSVTTLAVALVASGIFILATSQKVGATEVIFSLFLFLSGLALSGGIVLDIRRISNEVLNREPQRLVMIS